MPVATVYTAKSKIQQMIAEEVRRLEEPERLRDVGPRVRPKTAWNHCSRTASIPTSGPRSRLMSRPVLPASRSSNS